MRQVEKYDGARQNTNDVTTWRIRFACWINKATCTYAYVHAHAPGHTHGHACARHTDKYVMLIVFHDNNLFANWPRCYVICTVSVLFKLSFH
jgi:hypothetical protein